ncbi:Fe-S cluster assembly protein SufD [Marivirga sp. S37H4]|uniref:Fe-S cluster assembly protein SufD n=1 Tax=Marivirga aurantiaca TaxID=2802615 RepID=A0A934WXL5_9BACT|nr:Fe-S cluster assembly protein SufD [Marivirga aurantiaca]MBK6264782.1 Fe-S cluster assembly protein SufD [Marivirga aurantiaca]
MSKLTKEQVDHFFIDQFQSFENKLNGESKKPLHQLRKAAITAFKENGLPAAKNEEYKYTNIAKAFAKHLNVEALSDNNFALSSDEAAKYFIPELDAVRLVFVNGMLNKELSDLENLPEGLQIQPIKTAQDDFQDDFARHFNTHKIEGSDSFSDLNTAFTDGGVFIKISKSAVIEKPIACYYFTDAKEADVISQPRNLVIAEKNSQTSMVESYITIGEYASFTNAVTEIVVEDDSIFNYYKYQDESEKAIHVGATLVHQLGKSVFNSGTFSFNGAMIRNNLSIAVHSEHSETNMIGLYFLDYSTHVDNHTVVDHRVPNCESNETYKGVLDGKSRGVFNGKIFVRQPAQKTNAFQSNRNILMSDGSEMDTKPQLEIWADDVKCSHGCTVGQLDKDQLFYLKARGLDEKTAKSMLLNAFASDVVNPIKIEALKKLIESKIIERL